MDQPSNNPSGPVDAIVEHRNFYFPIVGIKLQNSGNATAVLWALDVIVDDIELDTSPEFSAGIGTGRKFSKRDGLEIAIQDNGWADELEGEFLVRSGILEAVFPTEALQHRSIIRSGQQVKIDVEPNLLSRDRLVKLLELGQKEHEWAWEAGCEGRYRGWCENEMDRRKRKSLEARGTRYPPPVEPLDPTWASAEFARVDAEHRPLFRGLIVDDLLIEYDATDGKGGRYQGAITPRIGPDGGNIYLSLRGFEVRHDHVCYSRRTPDTRYCSLIEVDAGNHVRSYKIAREIAPGDGEYFQIEIGANKSCRMKVRLRIFIDKSQVVETQPLYLTIKNDRRARAHSLVRDGSEMMLWPSSERQPTVTPPWLELSRLRMWNLGRNRRATGFLDD
ncbi:MAG: hypothetical protein ACXW27_06005 [Allosphingosinicella sp.]